MPAGGGRPGPPRTSASRPRLTARESSRMSDETPRRLQPSASYSFTMRLRMPQHGATFAGVAHAIAETDAMLGAIDLVRVESKQVVRDVTVACGDGDHAEAVVRAVRDLEGVQVDSVSDRTFLMHKGGKIEVVGKLPLKTRDDLSMAYTPGVGRVCMAIHDGPLEGVGADHQGQHGRRRLRRHRGARARRHRARGGDARDGGQGDAVQGVRGRRRLPAVRRHQGRRRDRGLREGGGADLRRHQPRGHLGSALLRDRAAAARGARHPGLPRRPARDGDRRAGRAAQRAEARRQAARGRHRGGGRRGRRGRGVHGDHAGPGVRRRDRLQPRRRAVRGEARAGRRAGLAGRAHEQARRPRHGERRAGRRRRGPGAGRPGSVHARTAVRTMAPARSSSRWPTRCPRSSPRTSARTWR